MQSKMYRPELDGLRAVAILAVVLYHAHVPGFSGGFVGVDIFFVLSGYLVTLLLYQEVTSTGTIALKRFFERRIRRLVPALVLVVCATLLLGAIFLTPIGGEQQGLARSALASIAMFSNVHFSQSAGGYFDGPAELQPLLHTWSLSVEAQFYLIWPLLIVGVSRFSHFQKQSLERLLILTVVILLGVSLTSSIWLTESQPQAAFFHMPNRVWEFATGALIVFWRRVARLGHQQANFATALGLGGILFSVVTYSGTAGFPGYLALLPALATSLFIFASRADTGIGKWLAIKPLVSLGGLSYSWYLWHWPLLAIARVHSLNSLSVGMALLLCVLSLGLAVLTYRLVENPIRKKRYPLMSTQGKTFRVGCLMGLTAICLSLSLGMWAKYLWPQSGANTTMQNAILNVQKVKIPECTQPSPYKGELIDVQNCIFPKLKDSPAFMVWGDSHAGHLVPMTAEFSKTADMPMIIRYMPQCPPIQNFATAFHLTKEQSTGCVRYNRDILEEIKQHSSNGLSGVVLSARWHLYLKDIALHGMTKQAIFQQFETGLRQTVSALEALHLNIVLVSPIPIMPFDAPACLARRNISECSTERETAIENREKIIAVFDSIARDFDAVKIIDPLEQFCETDYCSPLQGDTVLYSDNSHLTVKGSLRMMPLFKDPLLWATEAKSK